MRKPFTNCLFLFCFLCSFPAWSNERISASLIADTQSGYLFFKDNSQTQMAPASLTKLMTLYITFSALEKGWLKWDDLLPISEYAAAQPRTNLNLQAGQTITVRQAVEGMIVHSANDAAVVLAEALSQDEDKFAQIMTQTARQLKMMHTDFKNASGLHKEGQQTTAHDMAILALALIHHFPQYYPLFSKTSFELNGHTYTTHNRLLNDYQGTEGMKTGYVAAVGYNMISTVQKEGRRLVGVVMGANTGSERDKKMKYLLDKGFQRVEVQKQAVAKGELSPALDPLHRHFMLKKVDMTPYGFEMKRNMAQAIKLAQHPRPILFNHPPSDDSKLSTWVVQVGAFKTMNQAVQMSQKALALLETTKIKAEPIEKDSVFRAQLTGFSDKSDASQACHFLNKKDCPCFLVLKS